MVQSPAAPDAPRLRDLARVVRSKNAGPTLLTLDVFLRDDASFERACRSPALAAEAVARLYGVAASTLSRHDWPALRVIKFTLPRAVRAGSPGDGDVYGAQQHAPLLELQL